METEKKQDSEFMNYAAHAARELLQLKEKDGFSRLFYLAAIDLKDNKEGLVVVVNGGNVERVGTLLAGCFYSDKELATVAFREWLDMFHLDELQDMKERVEALIEKRQKAGGNG